MIYLLLVLSILWSQDALASGTVRYVDSTAGACTGNYSIASRNCTGSDGNSYATLVLGINAMAAGDLTYVRTGTYTETIGSIIPAGVSNSVRTVISTYNDETVTVNLGGSTHGIYITNKDYITLHGINWNRGANAPTSNGNTSNAIKLETGVDNVTISGPVPVAGVYKCKIQGAGHDGLNVQGVNSNITLQYCEVTGNGVNTPTSPYAHGAYFQRITGLIVTGNYFHTNGCYQMQVYPYTQNAVISSNRFKGNNTTSPCASAVNLANSGHLFERNVLERELSTAGYGLRLQYGTGGTPSNMIVRHNTFVGNWNSCVYIATNGDANTLQNNIMNGCTTKIENLGTNTVLTDNLTTGTASDLFTSVSAGAYNLTLKAGSAAIDGGTGIGGTANGTPDQGAHEVPTFSSCTVEAAATSVVRVSFTNNLRPPMLPADTITGVTFRKNGANNAVISSTRPADNMYEFTVTNSYAGGDTVDVSIVPASTNLTDSALIGGTNNQPFVDTVTNTACTNNTAGVIYTYTQARYEHHDWRGLENAPVILPHGFPTTGAAENFSNLKVRPSGKIRTRFAIVCGGDDCPSSSFYPYVSTGGAYASILDDFSVHNIKMCGVPSGSDMSANGSASTNQLSTSGTFTAGGIVFTSNGVPEVTGLNNGYKTELEYCFEFDSDASGNFDIRVYLDAGTALDTYTVTPRLVIEPAAAGAQ